MQKITKKTKNTYVFTFGEFRVVVTDWNHHKAQIKAMKKAERELKDVSLKPEDKWNKILNPSYKV